MTHERMSACALLRVVLILSACLSVQAQTPPAATLELPQVDWTVDNPGLLPLSRLSSLLIEELGSEQKPADGKKVGMSKTEFEVIEGIFHDGLGTYAELMLANKLIELARLNQPPFDLTHSESKMLDAMNRLPADDSRRAVFQREKANIAAAAERGAAALLDRVKPAALTRVRHTAREFSDARAGDLALEFAAHPRLPLSVKTDKSGKVAIAEGQTPDIGAKWAERYFQVNDAELKLIIGELGFSSMAELKANYLHVARLVAEILIRKLGLVDHLPADFSRAQVTNLDAAKHLFRQLLKFKHGNDGSQVIIFDRTTGAVKWESLLDGMDIESLTNERISLRPSRPRGGKPIGSEFGIKLDGKAVVTFQIKHKRGAARGTSRQYEFQDITTRLMI